MKKCDICKNEPAKHYLPFSGTYLCDNCFINYFNRKVKKYISEFKLFKKKRNYKVLIALSGGKDSASLLSSLSSIYKDRLEIITIFIDEGIPNYSEKMKQLAKNYAKRFGSSRHIETSYEDWIGKSFPEILNILRKKIKVLSPCSFCTIIKRRILDEYAKELKVDYLFTGHNLTDFIVSILINLFSGNYLRLIRLISFDRKGYYGYPPKHWPLFYLTSYETTIYAKIKNINTDYGTCPLKTGIRKYLENSIAELNSFNPTFQYNFLSVIKRLKKDLKIEIDNIYQCKYCGWITSNKDGICSYCKIKRMIEENE